MSSLNDQELTAYAFKSAISLERHLSVKIRAFSRSSRDRKIKNLCAGLLASCESRLTILEREKKNLNIK